MDDVTIVDPIHYDHEGWWFWDETWSYRHGPYATQEEAQAALTRYCRDVLGPIGG